MADRIAITGAAGGIGRVTAKTLRSAGYDVLLIDRPGPALDDLAAPLDSPVVPLEAAGVEAARAALATVDGPIYGLVHLAGVMPPDPDLADTPEIWQRAMADNLSNAYDFATAMEERLPPGRMGRMVFASSVAFRRGAGDYVAYSAAKAGLVGMTRALARRLRRRATVNAIAPGVIMTDMSVPLITEAKDRLISEIPLGRFGAAEEVAPAIRFLLGWEAGYITGQTLNIDGGMSMN
ncbi:3-oxoacyl-[acyl-carrier protein] reductase [Roseibacterium elongatum DSM 19469]|uniref:3-oxoacyl-[acyl-carrier protein] reductase n=1 Tax=Roseicyclus elongatus DSM 19469 TaxID=1294273 RepID=W8S6J7_9RHOB|nr:SDR family oxidoreductase [Roseibacterium elongatum]AHM04486.1 3-oxoacyl-[acyl-carrier protein] reductase [Roseibacterium elongatum DSM 19469]